MPYLKQIALSLQQQQQQQQYNILMFLSEMETINSMCTTIYP